MSGWEIVLVVIAAIIVPSAIGTLLRGLDRKLTARMQGRIGPPLLQPVYDIIKLLGKGRIFTAKPQLLAAWGYLLLIVAAGVLFALRQDLLLLILVLGLADVFLVVGSYSTRSPYSQIGANRELLQMLAYEPILIIAAVAISMQTGSFLISDISDPLLPELWLIYPALIIALITIMRKSPFDIATSEHAHQELAKGVTTEYSGPYLGLIEIAHCYELVIVLGLIALLWLNSLWVGVLLALAAWFVVLVIDNISARLTWSSMLKISWIGGLGIAVLNIIGLQLFGG